MIHATAVIDTQAELDADVTVGAHAVIEGPVRIGAGTCIYPGAYVSGHTTIGQRCQIHPGAAVGGPPQDIAYGGERSYCTIGDETIIREGASVHRGGKTDSSTVIGRACMLMCNAHVAHDCQLGDRVILTNLAVLAGHVVVEDDVLFAGITGVHQFVRIGTVAMISGMTRVPMDVPPFFICAGDGTCIGVNTVGMRRAGYSPAEIQDARQAYRTLYRSGLPFRRAVERLGETAATDTGRRIAAFIRAPSKRGCAGGARRGRDRRADRGRDESVDAG